MANNYKSDLTNISNELDLILDTVNALPTSGSVVQADWEQTDETASDYIKNKPDLSVYAEGMKLLNKFTLDSDVASVEFTATDDGIDYSDLSIRKLIIFTQTVKGTTATGTHMLFKFPEKTNFYTLTQSIGAAKVDTTDSYFTMLEVDLTKSILHHGGAGCKNGYATNIQYHTSLRGWASTIGSIIKNIEDPICDGVKWAAYTSGTVLPTGSKIEIWGCA